MHTQSLVPGENHTLRAIVCTPKLCAFLIRRMGRQATHMAYLMAWPTA